ncbi:hypothetical protein FRACYDRAFT_251151 [Fragilariopsis cylindrus CCMP1102]|uniref:Uncharacterized protein n=1 Tax=Fragilariopsis cylindrus CCMP1102 TaxID=635003 RepID=A0A1E7ENF7_9STRA|nr:hypothetical protein FRACYDRAFT_251151 [Fragilariopsis cylindrus CCMP1102]|eukprot:OEU07346.1 hypothetical protein FRACYDRAFT_251151 [Fragilariopsis cylindrus CCMP1102]
MTWKPPSQLETPSTTMITTRTPKTWNDNNNSNRNSDNNRRMNRNVYNHHHHDTRLPSSIAWKPPPTTSVIKEEKECDSDGDGDDDDDGYEDHYGEDKPQDNSIDIIRKGSKTIATNTDGNGGTTIVNYDVGRMKKKKKTTRTTIADVFRPYRGTISRYVVTKMKLSKPKTSNRSNDNDDDSALVNKLTSAMDGHHGENRSVSVSVSVSVSDREIAAFREGIRLAVCASITCTRLAGTSTTINAQQQQQQIQQRLLANDDNTIRLPPQRLQSIRAILQSLRAMSIARIRRETENTTGTTFATPPTTTNTTTTTTTKNFTNPIEDKKEKKKKNNNNNHDDVRKLLEELEEAEKYQRRLEQQLQKAGVVIAEDIPYDLAKQKVHEIAKRMSELHDNTTTANVEMEYFQLEQEMEKYVAALELTEEWIEEQAEEERKWEESIQDDNEVAYRNILRHMPVEVRNMSEAQLTNDQSPNGKYLPNATAKKFKRTNVLQMLRSSPDEISVWHPSTLENMRVTGLTLTERRALYHHLKPIGIRWNANASKGGGGDKMMERKRVWFETTKSNFKERLNAYQRHIDRYGPHAGGEGGRGEGGGCPLLGKQCPIKADKLVDYSGDYGYPEESVHFQQKQKQSGDSNDGSASSRDSTKGKDHTNNHDRNGISSLYQREKKERERNYAIKIHYKDVLQASLASGSCEDMDEMMDKIESLQEKWILLTETKASLYSFAERSGMKLTGIKQRPSESSCFQSPLLLDDLRSMVEISLCEEIIEVTGDLFEGIEERMVKIHIEDGRLKFTIEQLKVLLGDLQDLNTQTMDRLVEENNDEGPPVIRSRSFRTRHSIATEVQKELLDRPERKKNEDPPPPRPSTGNDNRPQEDLMSSLQGRGGRGDLLSALQGRGRGNSARGGRGRGGNRGDLLAALQGRGCGRGNPAGGRGSLMAAIAARGGSS